MRFPMPDQEYLALKALERLEYKKANRLYKDLVSSDLRNLEYLRGLALSILGQEKIEEAEKIADQMINLSPTAVETLEVMALLRIRQKIITEADIYAKEAYQQEPKNPRVLILCGLISNMMGDANNGFSYFQQANEIAPYNARILHMLWLSSIKVGKIDIACSAIKRRFRKTKEVRYAFLLSFMCLGISSKTAKIRWGLAILTILFWVASIVYKIPLLSLFPLAVLIYLFGLFFTAIFDPYMKKTIAIAGSIIMAFGIYLMITMIIR